MNENRHTVLYPLESGKISLLFTHWTTCTQGLGIFFSFHFYCKKQYRHYNTTTVHFEFLEILQTFLG
jgi:hypothetical protein